MIIAFILFFPITERFREEHQKCVEECIEYNELHNCTPYPCCVCNVWG